MPRDRYDDRDDRDDRDDDRPRRRRRYDDDDFDRPPPKKSNTGKVLLIVFGVLGAVLVLGGVGMYFAVQRVREASARMITSNNLIQIGLAAHNYHDAMGRMPSPYLDSGNPLMPPPPNPADRLSWRVDLLPYIEQDNLFRMIDRNQPWNGPVNGRATSTPVKTFGDPLDGPDANTRFRCFYDNGAMFSTDPKTRASLASIRDGTSNTLMVAESGDRVPWGQFNEWRFDPNGTPPPLGHPKRDAFLVVMADGSIRSVKKTVSPATLNAAIHSSDGQFPGADW